MKKTVLFYKRVGVDDNSIHKTRFISVEAAVIYARGAWLMSLILPDIVCDENDDVILTREELYKRMNVVRR